MSPDGPKLSWDLLVLFTYMYIPQVFCGLLILSALEELAALEKLSNVK